MPEAPARGAWAPRLRPDIEVLRQGGRVTALVDPTVPRRVAVGRLSAALVARLDGRATVDEVLAGAAADLAAADAAADAGELEHALRGLLLTHLLEGAGDEVVARVRAAQADPAPPRRVLEDGRFGCVGSGACCHVYRPGPLTDEDVAALAAATPALRAALPDLPPPEAWVEARPAAASPDDDAAPGDPPRRYLARVEGRCVFLRERLCGVHLVVGREAKPAACRLYPFDAVRTLEAVRVFDVGQCSAWATTSRQGPPHAEAVEEVLRLAPARLRLHHPVVLLDDDTPADYAAVLALHERALARPGPDAARPLEPVLALAALARAVVAALARCPLAPGAPARALAGALAADAAGLTPPLPAPGSDELALALEAVAAAHAAAAAEAEEDAPFALAFAEVLAAAVSIEADRAGLGDGPLPAVLREAAAVRLDADALAGLVRAAVRSRCLGARLTAKARLRAGVLRLALLAWLTCVGARVRAAAAGRAVAGPDELSAAHWVAAQGLDRTLTQRALAGVERHAWTVAGGLANALGARE